MRKLWLISRFMMSQTGQQIITIHILPNISNKFVKFDKLRKYGVRNIFLQKLCSKLGREISFRLLFAF